MYVGEMVEKGPAGAVLEEPAHPYTRALLESVPTPYPSSGGPSAPLEGEVPDPANPPSGCRFHPRCPDVIPSDTGVNSDELAAVIRFRSRLSDSPEAVVETAQSADDVEEAREALGLPRPDDASAERALRDAVGSLIEGNAEAALETLSEEFGTPCESEEPSDYTADGSEEHVTSCLLHDERFEG
jgi:peptide/nickel transport system ATP-binding protein